MVARYKDEFRRDAVRIATTSGLTRPQVSSDLNGPHSRSLGVEESALHDADPSPRRCSQHGLCHLPAGAFQLP